MTRGRPEAILERQVLAAVGHDADLALFKNECGQGYQARAVNEVLGLLAESGRADLYRAAQDILNRGRVHFGLHNGSADLVGVLASTGRFVSFELKSDTGTLRPEQVAWRARMQALGALAEVVRSPGEAAVFLDDARRGKR